ncbi:YitT family protein [Paenibacillus sp. MER 180]|uniref:YitT family protein n=3 Tax=Paenibacillus TaxID=44249 RepID=A0AAJ2K499_9BACL|nr:MULTISPECIES: YitT family protein [Paenibacillus]EPY09481.1 binding-protein-dependent transporter inner membrane component [Paenibacillus alvei A6-6i-x]MCM3288555.1 YitT family protein [Paenibacillus sp. MER 180]MCY9528633.1 YitT family protein [Paenibacillus alvei]MDT8979807.1 YitT family protein [Paenibacillus sp. chi10]TQR43728.1 YitT family protein [Paenibacillus sp. SDF0028]
MPHTSDSSISQSRKPRRNNNGLLLPYDHPMRAVMDYALLFLGAFIMALTFNTLMLPNKIASGGISGLSILLESQFGWNPAITQYAFNIPLFILGVCLLGKQFGIRTLVGSVSLPTFIYLTQHLGPATDNPLLAAIFGGIGIGLGLGIVFRGRGSTGGNAITAQLLSTFGKINIALSVAICDGVIILLAGFMLSFENAMYALIALFVTSKTIDVVQVGLGYTKVAFIISDEADKITDTILHDLDRGLTKLQGEGGYTGEGRTVLMVVVGQSEVYKLKAIVRSVDPQAFVIISDTNEVLGEGFKVQA